MQSERLWGTQSYVEWLHQTLPLKTRGIYAEEKAKRLLGAKGVGKSKETVSSRRNGTGAHTNSHKLTEKAARTGPTQVQANEGPRAELGKRFCN